MSQKDTGKGGEHKQNNNDEPKSTGRKHQSQANEGGTHRSNSKMEINIMNIAHGHDQDNIDHNSVHLIDEEELENPGQGDAQPAGAPIKFKRVKSHGLMCPLHPQQVGTWVTMTILVLSFYLFLVPGTYHIGTVWVFLI